MIELRVLGSIEVDGIPIERVRAILAQPKRLGLLAYLATCEGGGSRGRPDVTSILWPDSDPDRARGSLRNALHGLRALLGPETISSVGDRLATNPRLISCDAARFDRLLAEGRTAQALALYRGDLLPGLTVRGTARFSQWVEERRQVLRARAAEAAWRLADAADEEGNYVSAADHARMAARLSPDGEAAVRRLMRLLAHGGDRVAALREYEGFVGRWEREIGLRPSPETQALADALRAGPLDDRSVEVVSRSAAPSGAARRVIAVLPFRRVGASPGVDHLEAGLADGVISALSRMSGVRVVARSSVDRAVTEPDRSVPRIRELLGVDLVLDGSLRVSDDRLELAVRLVDASTGDPLWGDLYEADRSDLLSLQSELVLTVLKWLDVRVADQEEQYLSRRPTTSPEAYELYLRGRRLWNMRSRDDLEGAIRLFKQALVLDPTFALALVGLADARLTLYVAAGHRISEARIGAREAARQALDLDPRLGEAHATLGLLRGAFDLDWHGAETEFLRAIELNPGYATAHHWYGGTLSWVFRRFAEGARELELARQLDPLSPIIHNDIGVALCNQGRLHQALGKFEEALELEPDFWRAHYDMGVTLALCGDHARALEHLQRAWSLGAYGARGAVSGIGGGRAAWREAFAEKVSELASRRSATGTRAFEAALLSMLLGESDRAIGWLRTAEREGSWAPVALYFPAFEPLIDRPEFVDMMERAGLAAIAPREATTDSSRART